MKMGIQKFFFASLLGLTLVACGGGSESGVPSAPDAVAPACPAQLNTGYRTVSLANGRRAALWYPTTSSEASFQYAPDMSSSLAANSPPATCKRFPLVLFSHGAGGCGTQSLFITERIARSGYVVIAPDHADALCSVDGSNPSASSTVTQPNLLDPGSWTDTSHIQRCDDLRSAIDTMLASPEFSGALEASRIGIVGHSLGGYTALAMAGAWASWKDSRIGAAVLLSPYVQPFQMSQTLANVAGVPLLYQGAQLDIFITPALEGPAGAYETAQAPKYFAKLFLGTHFEWTNLLCGGTGSIDQCMSTRSNAALINNYSIAFLDRYLKDAPPGLLASSGAGLAAWQARPQ